MLGLDRDTQGLDSEQGIRARNLIGYDALDQVIHSQVSAVGHTYERRCMHGLLRAEGVRVCQQRVGDSLRRTFPFQHSIRRQNMHITVNPVPHRANYLGKRKFILIKTKNLLCME